ncbi:MAG: N-acetylmuramoyl-L-alanine amidase [Candidatus Sumerlaeaceae bacterium]
MSKYSISALFASVFVFSAAVSQALYPQPVIVTRAEWVARAPSCSISQCSPWEHVTIHHTAASSDYQVVDHTGCSARVRDHQNYHMDVNGWCDIGYNFLVCKHGGIFEGREGSISSYPRGAHDGINCPGLGVCCMGYFHPTVNDVPTPEMLNSTSNLIAWQWDKNGRQPFGTGNYGGPVENIIGGHRDVSATACPGDGFYIPYIGTDPNAGQVRNDVCTKQDLCPAAAPTPVHVNSIAVSFVAAGGPKVKARAVVNVRDALGNNIAGATVTGNFTGIIANSGLSGASDTLGNATINSTSSTNKTGTVTFTVTNISGSGVTYDSAANVVSSGSATR